VSAARPFASECSQITDDLEHGSGSNAVITELLHAVRVVYDQVSRCLRSSIALFTIKYSDHPAYWGNDGLGLVRGGNRMRLMVGCRLPVYRKLDSAILVVKANHNRLLCKDAQMTSRRHRGDGSVRRADDLISSALRPVDSGAWSPTDFMVWCHSASDRRMDRKSDHASLRLGTSSLLFDP
jgi:hypothetical protein